MSERVLPTTEGFWWVSIDGDKTIKYVFEEEGGRLFIISAVDDAEVDLKNLGEHWNWLEPVAPLGTSARLAEVERIAKELQVNFNDMTKEVRKLVEADDKITDICLSSGFGVCESTVDAVQKMANELAELKERIAAAPVGRTWEHDDGEIYAVEFSRNADGSPLQDGEVYLVKPSALK